MFIITIKTICFPIVKFILCLSNYRDTLFFIIYTSKSKYNIYIVCVYYITIYADFIRILKKVINIFINYSFKLFIHKYFLKGIICVFYVFNMRYLYMRVHKLYTIIYV